MARNPLTKLRTNFKDKIKLELRRGKTPWLEVEQSILIEVCRFLYEEKDIEFDFLIDLTAADYHDYIELVYLLYSYKTDQSLTIRVKLEPKNLKISSVVSIWPGADWLEREAYDMFGVIFQGHPNLSRILLNDDFQGYPLRKEFEIKERKFQGEIIDQD